MGEGLLAVMAFGIVIVILTALGIYILLSRTEPYRIVQNLDDNTYSAEERFWGFKWKRISFPGNAKEMRGINGPVPWQDRFERFDQVTSKLYPYMKKVKDNKLVVGKVSFDEAKDNYLISKV